MVDINFFSKLIYGYPSDLFSNINYLWKLHNGLYKDDPSFPLQFISTYSYRLLTFLPDAVSAYNLLFLGLYIINLVVILYLSKKILKNNSASLLTVTVIMTGNFPTFHSMQNLEFSYLFAVFLFLYSILKFYSEQSYKNSIFVALTFSLAMFISFQFALFSLVILIFASIYHFFSLIVGKRLDNPSDLLRKYIVIYVLCFIFTLPSTYLVINKSLNPHYYDGTILETLYERNSLLDLVAYGARPWDYLMPSIYHPVFGSYVQNFYQYIRNNYSYQFWSTFLPERANYLTFTGMGLALYALWTTLRSWRRRINVVSQEDSRNIGLLMLMAIFMFLVSMPAVIEIKGFHIYFPSYFLFKVFPMFRVYARAGVFVLLSVAILAGYGLKFLLAKIRNDWFSLRLGGISFPGRKSVVLTTVLCGLVLFENLNFPPFAVMDVGHVPQVYAWLKNQPGDPIIAEYPRDNSVVDIGGGCPSWLDPKITRDYNGAYTAFYQTVHGKKTFGGEKLSKDELVALGDLAVAGSYQVLKKYGVSYVLAHTKDPMIGIHPWPYPQENPLDACWQRRIMKKPEKVYEGFQKVAEFYDGVVYKVQ